MDIGGGPLESPVGPRGREAGVDIVLLGEQAYHRRAGPPLWHHRARDEVELPKTVSDTVRTWPSRAHLRSPGEQSTEIARDGEKRAPIRAIDRGAIRRDADRAASGGLPPLRTRSRATRGHCRQ